MRGNSFNAIRSNYFGKRFTEGHEKMKQLAVTPSVSFTFSIQLSTIDLWSSYFNETPRTFNDVS